MKRSFKKPKAKVNWIKSDCAIVLGDEVNPNQIREIRLKILDSNKDFLKITENPDKPKVI